MNTYINIHSHIKNDVPNITVLHNALLFEPLPDDIFSIGMHPWQLSEVNFKEAFEWVKNNLTNNYAIALGEIGLDRVIEIEIEFQKKVFTEQYTLASLVNKPIIIHCVKAYSDFLELHKQLNPKNSWIFHGFNANKIIANEFLNRGCYLSFGPDLLSSTKVQDTFRALPLDKIFFETDESDVKIEAVYEKAANLRHICVDDLKDQIHLNFINVFGEQWNKIG